MHWPVLSDPLKYANCIWKRSWFWNDPDFETTYNICNAADLKVWVFACTRVNLICILPRIRLCLAWVGFHWPQRTKITLWQWPPWVKVPARRLNNPLPDVNSPSTRYRTSLANPSSAEKSVDPEILHLFLQTLCLQVTWRCLYPVFAHDPHHSARWVLSQRRKRKRSPIRNQFH